MDHAFLYKFEYEYGTLKPAEETIERGLG
jgi:hypothetical protein